jgi:glucoamylase
VTDVDHFKVMYSVDGWKTSVTKDSRPVGYSGFYADIQTVAGQAGAISFTYYWPRQDKWLGTNFEVTVEE